MATQKTLEKVSFNGGADELLDWLAAYYKRPDTPVVVGVEDEDVDDLVGLNVVERTLSDKSTYVFLQLRFR